jgi:hypothetical protein
MHDQPEENIEEAFHNTEVVEPVEVVDHVSQGPVVEDVAAPVEFQFDDIKDTHSKRAGLALDLLKVLLQVDTTTPRTKLVDEAYDLADHFQETLDNRFQDAVFKRMADSFNNDKQDS